MDEIKHNNKVSNLNWVTQSENQRWNDLHIRRGISCRNNHLSKPISCYDLDMNLIKNYPSISEASRDLNIRTSNISRVVLGKRSRYHNYIFKEQVIRTKEDINELLGVRE